MNTYYRKWLKNFSMVVGFMAVCIAGGLGFSWFINHAHKTVVLSTLVAGLLICIAMLTRPGKGL